MFFHQKLDIKQILKINEGINKIKKRNQTKINKTKSYY